MRIGVHLTSRYFLYRSFNGLWGFYLDIIRVARLKHIEALGKIVVLMEPFEIFKIEE